MRGLELRKGTVDLIVNDLSPDIVWQLQHEGRMQVATAAGTDYAYVGHEPAAIPLSATSRYARPSATRSIATPSSITCAVALRHRPSASFRRCRGRSSATCSTSRHDPAEAERLLDAAGYPDPDGPGPLPRLRLSLKTSTSEVYRLQAAAIQHDLARVGIAIDDPVVRVPDAVGRRAPGQFSALHAAVGRRHRSRHVAAACITRGSSRRPGSIGCTTATPTWIG